MRQFTCDRITIVYLRVVYPGIRRFTEKKRSFTSVYGALNSRPGDAPSIIEQIRELLSTTHNYMCTTNENVHGRLLQNIYKFIMDLFDTLGLKYPSKLLDDI